MSLQAALRRAFPDGEVTALGERRFELQLDAPVVVTYLDPWEGRKAIRLCVETIPLQGFELTLGKRSLLRRIFGSAPSLDGAGRITFDAYGRKTNDAALAELWLDIPARAALAQTTRARPGSFRDDVPPEIDLAIATLADGRVAVRPASADDHDLTLALRACVTLALRPRRLAEELHASLGLLGLQFDAAAWRMDADCVGVFTRGMAKVFLDWRRTDELVTRLRAEGPGTPPSSIDSTYDPLVRAAGGDLSLTRSGPTLTWSGMVRTPQALAPAIELLCRLVTPGPSTGAYR